MKSVVSISRGKAARGLLLLLLLALIFTMFGCATAQKTAPHMGIGRIDVEADFDRNDFVVMDSVTGTSTETSILFGLLQIIDEDKYKILFINTFTDKYTYFGGSGGFLGFLFGAGPEDRAYYKALEKASDADFVLLKSMDIESSGIPLLATTKTVTWRGKAMRIKSSPTGEPAEAFRHY